MVFGPEAVEATLRWVREVLDSSDAGDWRPLARLIEGRPQALAMTVVAEMVHGWRNEDGIQRAVAGDRRRGRPSGSAASPHLIFYVAAARKRHGLETDEAALHWISEHRDEFPLRYPFESLKAAYYAAKRDRRYQPTLLWDITREELLRLTNPKDEGGST